MGERIPIETRCELVLTALRMAGHEKTCTEANVKTAIRQELGIWRSDRLKDFFNYMVDTEYVTLVGAGLYAVKQREGKAVPFGVQLQPSDVEKIEKLQKKVRKRLKKVARGKRK